MGWAWDRTYRTTAPAADTSRVAVDGGVLRTSGRAAATARNPAVSVDGAALRASGSAATTAGDPAAAVDGAALREAFSAATAAGGPAVAVDVSNCLQYASIWVAISSSVSGSSSVGCTSEPWSEPPWR